MAVYFSKYWVIFYLSSVHPGAYHKATSTRVLYYKKTSWIHNLGTQQQASVFICSKLIYFYKPKVFSLLQNLSISHKLQVRNVL
jgi:hypothetical protein